MKPGDRLWLAWLRMKRRKAAIPRLAEQRKRRAEAERQKAFGPITPETRQEDRVRLGRVGLFE